jgi:hypothetical protein
MSHHYPYVILSAHLGSEASPSEKSRPTFIKQLDDCDCACPVDGLDIPVSSFPPEIDHQKPELFTLPLDERDFYAVLNPFVQAGQPS